MIELLVALIILVVVCAVAFWLIDHIGFPSQPPVLVPALKTLVVLVALVALFYLAAPVFHIPVRTLR